MSCQLLTHRFLASVLERRSVVAPSVDAEIFCGVARLPREMAALEPSIYLAVELEVDMESQTIVDVACTALPVLCENMLETALLGKEPVAGVAEARLMLKDRYHSIAKAAVDAALQTCFKNIGREGQPGR